MMLTLLAALTFAGVQDAPPVQSAQCLVEVAALTLEDLDLTNPDMHQAVVRKTDALWLNQQEMVATLENIERARAAVLSGVPGEIERGALPEGSLEVIRQRQERDRAEDMMIVNELPSQAPSCVWPRRDDQPVIR